MIDLPGHVLLPGLVNTHHHLFQTLTRALPAAQDASLFDWLRTLYPVWARLTPEMIHASALTGFAELLLSGCTTTSDHLYLYPERQPARRHAARPPPRSASASTPAAAR